MSLTDSWLKAAHNKVSEKPYEKADRDGLSVRVSAKGKVVFQMRFAYAGKQQRCDLGTYPLLGLKDARLECQRYRAALEKGDDPRIVKALELTEKQEASTVAAAFTEWYQNNVADKRASAHESWRSIELHVLPKLGKLPLNQVTLHHWLGIIEPLAKKSPAMSVRVLTQCRQMLRWAVRRRIVKDNPLLSITAKHDLHVTKGKGERALSDDELALLFEYFEYGGRMDPKNLLFMKLCLLYGCRNGELRKAKKSDFDFGRRVWTVPPENRKTGKGTNKPMLRPIPQEFDDDIKQLMSLSAGEYLVPLAGSDKPLSSSASLSLPYRVMQWARKHKSIEMEHWSLHDLRRTARTNFGKLCNNPVVPEKMLDHTLPGMMQVYDQGDYLPEQMVAYQAWHRKLMIIAGKADADNVVAIKTPALAKG